MKRISLTAAALLAAGALTAHAEEPRKIPSLWQLVTVTVSPPTSLAACLDAKGAALRKPDTLSASCIQPATPVNPKR